MAKSKQEALEPTPKGVYRVRVGEYPGLTIDSGLPAGPEAEAVVRREYLQSLQIQRMDLVPQLELVA